MTSFGCYQDLLMLKGEWDMNALKKIPISSPILIATVAVIQGLQACTPSVVPLGFGIPLRDP